MRAALNRVLSFLLGAALVVGGLTALVDGLLVAADRSTWVIPGDRWYSEGRSTLLGDDLVLGVCLLTALAGLMLLVVQTWRRPPARVPLDDPRIGPLQEPSTPIDDPDVSWWLARRAGERRLARAAQDVTEVEDVRVRLRRRFGRWRANVAATADPANAADPAPDLEQRVHAELEALAASTVSVRTDMRRRAGASRRAS